MYDVFLIFFIWLEDLLAQVCMVCFLMYHVIFFINNISLLLLKNILFSFYFKGNFILFTLKKGEKKLRHHKIITDLRWYWIYTMVHQKKKKKKNLNDVLQGNPTQPCTTCLCHGEQCLGPKWQSTTRCLTVIFASQAQRSQFLEGPMSNCQWTPLGGHNFFPLFSLIRVNHTVVLVSVWYFIVFAFLVTYLLKKI